MNSYALQVLGRPRSAPPPIPPKPIGGYSIRVLLHPLHWRCSLEAREDRTDAWIMIPGMRTSFESVLACISVIRGMRATTAVNRYIEVSKLEHVQLSANCDLHVGNISRGLLCLRLTIDWK